MEKKRTKVFVAVVCMLAVLWVAVFVTDYNRCAFLQQPLFVVAKGGITADDGGSGTYLGLGYTVDIEKYIDIEYGICISSVEMKVLGKTVIATIA